MLLLRVLGLKRRHIFEAAALGERTAKMKWAAGGRIGRTGHLAAEQLTVGSL